ncbi:hypothetical protein Unana1_06170 [Umbelopsis nana]
MSLNDQLKSFKKSLASQPVYGVKRSAAGTVESKNESRASSTPSTPAISNNTRAAYESAMEGKKKNKRGNQGIVYSQPANTGAGTHTMSLLYTVVNFLKNCDDPQSVVSIQSRTNVDIRANAELWEKLTTNEKIDYDSVNGTFSYKPTFQIRSKVDLLELLQEKRSQGGMDYKDLKDSYSKLGVAVEELAAEDQILVIRHKDGNPRVLFCNDEKYNTPIDDEFKKMWAEIPIPDETDLPRELESAGLKTMEVFEKKVITEPKQKKSKNRNRKGKITNTHLQNLDLTVDYVPRKTF